MKRHDEGRLCALDVRCRSSFQAVVLLALAVCLLPSGCRSTPRSETASGEGAAEALPPDLRLTFGQGGGFAGLWNGYTIEADGTVRAWSGRLAGENPQPAGRLSTARMDTLWQHVEAVDYFAQDRREVGNRTAFMEITAQGRTHRVSWIPSVEGVEPISSPLEQLYVYCRDVARSAQGK